MPAIFTLFSLEAISFPIALFVSAVFAVFLFWRSSRYELVDSQDIFDVVLLFVVSGLIFGRIGDFLVRFDFYSWSLKRLFFFNVFSGFDYFFAFLGGAASVWFYFKNRRENFWFVFDLAAAPFAFGTSLYFGLRFLFAAAISGNSQTNINLVFPLVFFFIVYWVLKRLEKRKRHRGFFADFFLVASAIGSLIDYVLFESDKAFMGKVNYQLVVAFIILFAGTLLWYLSAKRKVKEDLKAFSALILLAVFKTKRVLFSVREADTVAKNIILSPYLMVKGLYFLVKLVSKEIAAGTGDFIHALGFKK